MGTYMKYLKIAALISFIVSIILIFSSANASEVGARDTERMDLKYDVFWSGFQVGEMNIKLRENKESYTYTTLIDSMNIAKYFTKYYSINSVQGDIVDGKPKPKAYDSKWSRKKDNQVLHVAYSDDGSIIEETAVPAKEESRPEIEPHLTKNSFDPITSGIQARDKIKEIMASNPQFPVKFTVPVYDAKRLFDVEYTINGYQMVNVDNKNHNLLHISFQRKPIAGFRDKELKRMAKQEPVIDAYLNKDFIPVWGLGTAQLGIATIKLSQYCIGINECLGAQEVAAK